MGYTLYILRQYNILNLKVSAKRCISKLKVGAKNGNCLTKVSVKSGKKLINLIIYVVFFLK